MPVKRRVRQLIILLTAVALLATVSGPWPTSPGPAGGSTPRPRPTRTASGSRPCWGSTPLGGRSWRLMRLRKTGPGHYQAVIPRSRLQPGGWVSMRSWARDAGDSPVQQTLIRTFPVR